MDVIGYEVDEIKKICENVVDNSKLVTCMRSLIRIDIKQTISRQITICIRFPDNYPNQHLLVELKSRTLSGKLLNGITTLAEQKGKEFLGKPQILQVIKFINAYLKENPLCVIYDEISAIKEILSSYGNNDETNQLNPIGGELKCRQKTSSVSLTIKSGDYFFKGKIFVPDEYPTNCISWDDYECNFPITIIRFLNGQAKEIARKCVEPPVRLDLTKHKFEPKPSFMKTVKFLVEAIADFPTELCPVCKKKCLPDSASNIEANDLADNYVERVYCGHIYHQGCLKRYMREPPFTPGGKLCPALKKHPRSDRPRNNLKHISDKNIKTNNQKSARANTVHAEVPSELDKCQIRLSHDRWGLNVKLAEARWAQQQARERELEEVIDFLK